MASIGGIMTGAEEEVEVAPCANALRGAGWMWRVDDLAIAVRSMKECRTNCSDLALKECAKESLITQTASQVGLHMNPESCGVGINYLTLASSSGGDDRCGSSQELPTLLAYCRVPRVMQSNLETSHTAN